MRINFVSAVAIIVVILLVASVAVIAIFLVSNQSASPDMFLPVLNGLPGQSY